MPIGLIIAPNGQNFVAKGLNIYADQLSAAVGDGINMPLTSFFPGLNMVRVNFEGAPGTALPDVTSMIANIQSLTAKGIVVELEDHTGISNAPYTGSQLAAEQAWYSAIATMFKNNPYVWFGTYNEPGNGTNLAGIAAQELATYNTIRATGNNNPILMEEPSGGNPGLVGATSQGYDGAGPMTPSDYASMHNIIWDLHYYGWVSGYSTDQATVSADLTGSAAGANGILGAQTITSADSTVPVIIGEFGNSTTGGAIDTNGDQVIQAVASSGKGFLAWGWNPDPDGDQAINGSGQITAYGRQIAAIIGNTPAVPPGSPNPTPTPSTPSANNTVVKIGSTAAITDANSNKWTITAGGQVAVNGATDTTTSGVKELAYVNGTVWQENGSNLWWGKTSPTAAWAPDPGTAVSPLPVVTPPPTPSPNDTVVKLGSTAAITDANKVKWTITAGGQVAVNGAADTATSNVIELAYVNGTIWQENASKLWWGKATPAAAWAPDPGTAISPLPVVTPTPTASPNDTVVNLGSTAAITDANKVKWTITAGGQVAVNGATDTTTSGVKELAYVNGTVWQENGSNLWWGKTTPTAAWAPGPGTATSPLPTSITIPATQASITVSMSQVSINATAGDHMVFITGSGNKVNLTGGKETITDTGGTNTYVIPVAGKGYDTFTNNVLTKSDTLDLRTALAATTWDHSAATLSKYLAVTNPAQGSVISIAPTSGGVGVAVATIGGASGTTLTSLLTHALT